MEHLLLCETKEDLAEILERTFRRRNMEDAEHIKPLLEHYVVTLKDRIDLEQADTLRAALQRLIKQALYLSAQLGSEEDYLQQLQHLLPQDRKLTKLLIKLLHKRLDEWRKVSLQQRVSMARYKSSDWRVDVKCASNNMSSIMVPSVIGTIKLQTPPQRWLDCASEEEISLELSKSTLDALVTELGKVESWVKKVHKG